MAGSRSPLDRVHAAVDGDSGFGCLVERASLRMATVPFTLRFASYRVNCIFSQDFGSVLVHGISSRGHRAGRFCVWRPGNDRKCHFSNRFRTHFSLPQLMTQICSALDSPLWCKYADPPEISLAGLKNAFSFLMRDAKTWHQAVSGGASRCRTVEPIMAGARFCNHCGQA